MINTHWLELPLSRTFFHSSKGARAIEVRLCSPKYYAIQMEGNFIYKKDFEKIGQIFIQTDKLFFSNKKKALKIMRIVKKSVGHFFRYCRLDVTKFVISNKFVNFCLFCFYFLTYFSSLSGIFCSNI